MCARTQTHTSTSTHTMQNTAVSQQGDALTVQLLYWQTDKDPGKLNADKVLQCYDAMKPEIGNKSYMDRGRGMAGGWRVGGFSGASVAPAVTPKMCQRQQTLNTAQPLLFPPPPVVDHVAAAPPTTTIKLTLVPTRRAHWSGIDKSFRIGPALLFAGIKGNQQDGLNLTPTNAESWHFNHCSSQSNRRPSWRRGWKPSSSLVGGGIKKKDKIIRITFEGYGWKKRRWIKKKKKNRSGKNNLHRKIVWSSVQAAT